VRVCVYNFCNDWIGFVPLVLRLGGRPRASDCGMLRNTSCTAPQLKKPVPPAACKQHHKTHPIDRPLWECVQHRARLHEAATDHPLAADGRPCDKDAVTVVANLGGWIDGWMAKWMDARRGLVWFSE